MKLLVTGGAGFIGSAVVRLAIAQGHQVVVLDKYNIAPFAFKLHFVIQEELPLKRSQRSNSGHSSVEVLLVEIPLKGSGKI